MKKNLGILFALFTISTFTNLNANSENLVTFNDPYVCYQVAEETLSAYQDAQLKRNKISSHLQEYNVWAQAYDSCMGGS